MRKLPLRQMAEDLAKDLAAHGWTYRDWERMSKSDQRFLVAQIHRKLLEVDKLHRSAE